MSWRAALIGRATGEGGGREDFEEMLEEAYEKGKEKGYRKAMSHMEGGYGERGGYSGGTDTYMGGGYGRRDGMPYMDDDDDDDYGERRGVRGTGPYSRYTRSGRLRRR